MKITELQYLILAGAALYGYVDQFPNLPLSHFVVDRIASGIGRALFFLIIILIFNFIRKTIRDSNKK